MVIKYISMSVSVSVLFVVLSHLFRIYFHLPHYHAAEVDATIGALYIAHPDYSHMALYHRVFVRNTSVPTTKDKKVKLATICRSVIYVS